MALEDATGAKIPDEALANLHTVNDVLTYIKENAAWKKLPAALTAKWSLFWG